MNQINIPQGAIPEFAPQFKANKKGKKSMQGVINQVNAYVNSITDEMTYDEFNVLLKRELDLQNNLTCPIIVRVTKQKADKNEEINDAFANVENTLIKYIFPTSSPV